jgi:hypothetical protein
LGVAPAATAAAAAAIQASRGEGPRGVESNFFTAAIAAAAASELVGTGLEGSATEEAGVLASSSSVTVRCVAGVEEEEEPALRSAEGGVRMGGWATSEEELALERGAGLHAFRLRGSPGVFLGTLGSGRERKVAAVGMACSKWVTQHGFAINVCPELSHFEHIVPCGIKDGIVTSVAKELAAGSSSASAASIASFKPHVLAAFEEVFNVQLVRED